jgi:hypothetical protein
MSEPVWLLGFRDFACIYSFTAPINVTEAKVGAFLNFLTNVILGRLPSSPRAWTFVHKRPTAVRYIEEISSVRSCVNLCRTATALRRRT